MTATVSIRYDIGGSDNSPGTEQDIDALGPPGLRFKQADNATIDANDIMPVPSGSAEYSRWKQVYLYCDVAPDTQIDAIKLYSDGGGYGTGITVNVADEFPVKNSGSDAGYDVSDTNQVMTNHTDVTGVTDLFSFTVGSPLSGSISESGSVINAIGETSNYFVLQMVVLNTASISTLSHETITIQYDET